MSKRLDLFRDVYLPQTTLGRLFVDGVFFCYTLEDTVRPLGIKVKDHTAIAEGTYIVSVNVSPKFKRRLPYVHNTPQFIGIRFHRLSTHRGTSGCVGIGYDRNKKDGTISRDDGAEAKLVSILDDGGEHILHVRNLYNEDR